MVAFFFFPEVKPSDKCLRIDFGVDFHTRMLRESS